MMGPLEFLLFLGIVVVATTLVVVWLSGGFAPVRIEMVEYPELKLLAEGYVGDYAKCGTAMNRIYLTLKRAGIVATRGFGLYYDNPKLAPKDRCRADIGCVLDCDADPVKIGALPGHIRAMSLDGGLYPTVRLPLKNKLSYILGATKAYSKLAVHMKASDREVAAGLEIYDMAGKTIDYIICYREALQTPSEEIAGEPVKIEQSA
ncbi:MAG: hypothetical protein U9N14_06415 [Pseudomonadota bacterium]|nr:hypothetical protein [Pseudomonadota bacterium]